MKKALTPVLAIVAVIAVIFCFVINGQKGSVQSALDAANAQIESLKKESETKLAEASSATEAVQKALDDANAQIETLKAEGETKLTEVSSAAESVQKALDDANAQIETLKADVEAKAAEAKTLKADAEAKAAEAATAQKGLEDQIAELKKQIEDAAAAAKEVATEAVENVEEAVKDIAEEVTEAAEEAVEDAKETVDEAAESAAEAVEGVKEEVTEAVEGAAAEAAETAEEAVEAAAEATEEAAVMSHEEYIAAAVDDEVVIESWVQDHQSWWDNKVTVYLQSPDGAYFAYELACSEEDAAKLVPGAKIRVKGYKGEWAGEVEIMDGTFEFVDGEAYIAEATDVTALLATEELAEHMNEFVAVKGATIAAQEDGAAFAYKNAEEKTDDLYFAVEVDGQIYNFCVEYYLRGKDSEVYKAVEGLNVGDEVDIEGFLYWYNGANLQATSLTVK